MKSFNNIAIKYKILLTGFLIIIIFFALIFGYLFPQMKSNILGMKKIALKEITRSAYSIIDHYYQEYRKGKFTKYQAKVKAIRAIRSFRYGPEMKDYVWINNFHPTMIMHPYVTDLNGKDLTDYKDPNGKHLFVEFVKVCEKDGHGFVDYMWQWKDNKEKIVPKISYVMAFRPWKWILGTGLYVEDTQSEIEMLQGNLKISILIIFVITGISALVFLFLISRSILNPIKKIMNFARKMSNGELGNRIDIKRGDELGILSEALNESANHIEKLITDIKNNVSSLEHGVNEIASGNTNLSERVTSQAAALEEIVSAIEEFHISLKQNDDNTGEAQQLSINSSKLAQEGGGHAQEAINSINEVNKSSEKIREIVSLINEISFQTNLLALNAAVEAARAGEFGRGFAVVAGEVRNLAQRSTKAAKDIEGLINETLVKIEEGTTLVNNSGKSLNDIIKATEAVLKVVSKLTLTLGEQKNGMEQIATAISNIDTMTQENASLVEETASASENMTQNMGDLAKMVGYFKISESQSN